MLASVSDLRGCPPAAGKYSRDEGGFTPKLSSNDDACELIVAIHLCRNAGWSFVISHLSGETEGSFMAEYAVAMGGGQNKTGSMYRSERIAK